MATVALLMPHPFSEVSAAALSCDTLPAFASSTSAAHLQASRGLEEFETTLDASFSSYRVAKDRAALTAKAERDAAQLHALDVLVEQASTTKLRVAAQEFRAAALGATNAWRKSVDDARTKLRVAIDANRLAQREKSVRARARYAERVTTALTAARTQCRKTSTASTAVDTAVRALDAAATEYRESIKNYETHRAKLAEEYAAIRILLVDAESAYRADLDAARNNFLSVIHGGGF
jgi:hypothetical protein